MKPRLCNNKTGKALFLIFLAFSMLIVSSCSNKITMEESIKPHMADQSLGNETSQASETTENALFGVKEFYSGEDFGITRLISDKDENNNGIDDYTDILEGALIQAALEPVYLNKYYEDYEGYPPDGEGVCTDFIWRALSHAGYNLKEMLDEDIENDLYAYPSVDGTPDTHIDFRRVRNLNVFFSKYLVSLTTDVSQISQWQPGDIVIIGDDDHIVIISDQRNEDGVPYILHSSEDEERDYHEDFLQEYAETKGILAHFRWEFTDN